MTTRTETVVAPIFRRQTLEAVVRRACCFCGAPPTYQSELHILCEWPGCWVREGDPRDRQSVGDTCANCYRPLAAPENRGVIWQREWRAGGRLARVVAAFRKRLRF